MLLPPSWGGEETEPPVRRQSSLIEHVLYVCPIAWNLWMLIDLIISRAWETAMLHEKKNAYFADSAWSCTPLITVRTLWVQVTMVYRVRLFLNKQTNEHINKKKNNVYLTLMTAYLFFWSFIPFVRCKWDTLNVIFVKEPKCLALLIHTLFHLCDYFSSTRSSLQYYGNVCLSQLYMQNSYHGYTIS